MNFRTLKFLAFTLIPCIAGCAMTAGSQPRYGVCRQEMIDFVEQQLRQTPTRIEIQAYSERTPPMTLFDTGSALVYVKECSGFHAFEIRGTESICEHIPHYGKTSGSYVYYEGAFEGCRKS